MVAFNSLLVHEVVGSDTKPEKLAYKVVDSLNKSNNRRVRSLSTTL